MAKQRIDSLFDLSKLNKEADEVNSLLEATLDKIEKLSGNKKPIVNTKSLKDVSKSLKDVSAQTSKLADKEKILQRETKKLTKMRVQLSEANKQNIKDQERLKVVKKEAIQQARMEATVNQYGEKSIKGLQIRLREAQDEYARLTRTQGENSAAAKQQQQVVMQLQGEYYKAQQGTKYFAVNMSEVTNATRTANMSIKQMQDELLRLKSVDFAAQGLSPEQIQQVQVRMAQLTDGIGDANARIKMMATDTIPLFGMGLQTLVGGAQAVTGTLRAFGVENAALERSMMALINVSMGLQTIQKAYNDRLGTAIKLRFKEITATGRATMATKLNTAAQNSNNKVTAKLFKTLAKNPYLAIAAAVVAVGAAIYGLIKAFQKEQTTLDSVIESQSELIDGAIETDAKMRILQQTINDTRTSEEGRNKAIDEYNELAKEAGLNTLNYSDSVDELNAKIKENTRLLYAQVAAEAVQKQMVELTQEYIKTKIKLGNEESFVTEEITEMYYKQMDQLMSLQRVLGQFTDAKQKSNATPMPEADPETPKNITKTTESVEDLKDEVIELSNEIYKLATKDVKQLKEEFAEPMPETMTEGIEYMNEKIKEGMLASKDGVESLWRSGKLSLKEYEEALLNLKKLEDEAAQARIDSGFEYADGMKEVFGQITEITGNHAEQQTQILEAGYNEDLANLQERYDQGLVSEDQYNLQKQALEDEYNAEKLAIEKQQFEREKAVALAGVAIDTAKAVQKAIAESPATFGLPFSAFALAQGIAQGAIITSQQFPQYRTGRRGGEAEFAYVHPGEIVEHNGKMFLTPNQPETLTYLPKDSSVYTANETAKILQFYGQSTTQSGGWEQVVQAINGQEGVNINITRSGVHGLARSGDNVRHYRNANFKYSNSRKTW